MLGLYQDILIGLRSAARTAAQRGGRLAGVAVDSWAVDYGLLDGRGALLGNPRHYRDPRTEPVIDQVHRRVDPAQLYRRTGLQHLPFNTLYQFAAEPDLAGRTALLIPDLIGYWLTGVQVAEQTNASTTGLLDARSGEWDRALIEQLGLPADLLPDVVPAGQVIGPLSPAVREELGLQHDIVLSTVGSHDTASAVVGVPADEPAVRLHLLRHVGSGRGRAGRPGAHRGQPAGQLHQRARRRRHRPLPAQRDGPVAAVGVHPDLEPPRHRGGPGAGAGRGRPAARGRPADRPQRPAFLPPGDMPQRIAAACRESGQTVPETAPAVVRCILDSLAAAFAETIEQAERLSGQPIEVVHIVGGGARNALLCQLTADACARPVVAGPVEATALGNLIVQARTLGAVAGDLAELRRHVRAASSLARYRPRSGARQRSR